MTARRKVVRVGRPEFLRRKLEPEQPWEQSPAMTVERVGRERYAINHRREPFPEVMRSACPIPYVAGNAIAFSPGRSPVVGHFFRGMPRLHREAETRSTLFVSKGRRAEVIRMYKSRLPARCPHLSRYHGLGAPVRALLLEGVFHTLGRGAPPTSNNRSPSFVLRHLRQRFRDQRSFAQAGQVPHPPPSSSACDTAPELEDHRRPGGNGQGLGRRRNRSRECRETEGLRRIRSSFETIGGAWRRRCEKRSHVRAAPLPDRAYLAERPLRQVLAGR